MDDQDLLQGDAKLIAKFLGVSLRAVQHYRLGDRPLPATVRKLLQIRLGDLSALAGDQWQGFSFGRDEKLYLPTYRNGFDPDQIRSMFFVLQEAAALRNELKAVKNKLWAYEKMRSMGVISKPRRPASVRYRKAFYSASKLPAMR
jgi:hypothetical protein